MILLEIHREENDNLIELIYNKWLTLRSTKLKYLVKGKKVSLDDFLIMAKDGIEFENLYGYTFNSKYRNKTEKQWAVIETNKIIIDDRVFGIISEIPNDFKSIEWFEPFRSYPFNQNDTLGRSIQKKMERQTMFPTIKLYPIINQNENLETFDVKNT